MKAKTFFKILVFCLTGLFFFSLASAVPRVNPKRGKVFFKKSCRVCHDGKQEGIVKLDPIAKTMEQWEKVFAEEGPALECLPQAEEKLGKKITDRDLRDMQSYLIRHAADSDQPASCGT